MITIYDILGEELFEVPVTSACEKVEELMTSDHIKLSWRSPEHASIPAGSYIVYEGETYSLIDEYRPQQKTEVEWLYEPEFQSSIMEWQKVPFFMYTNLEAQVAHREIDWTLTGGASLFLERILLAIQMETGETYAASTDAAGSKNLAFSSTDIYSALNAIADAFDTEWWVDKEQKVIHLSKAYRGDAVTLEVGDNVGVPSSSGENNGYFNRFYVFGSTRNIVQSYNGANVNNIVNKRLTLDPTKYPHGYYEPDGPKDKVFSKILVFDDIYPAATDLRVYDTRVRFGYVRDKATGNRIQIGTNAAGQPVYDIYAEWYIKLGYKNADGTYRQFFLNNWNYSEDPQKQGGAQPGRQGMKIAGQAVSVNFTSGSLRGRDFTVEYFDNAVDMKSLADETGVVETPIHIDAGMFRINFTEEGNYIIPDYASLMPNVDDTAIVFNIKMPEEYTSDAYARLETEMLKTIREKYTEDRLQYSFNSNPVAFLRNYPDLKVGTRVNYVNEGVTLETRVVSLTTRLENPIRQNITVGNSLVKGAIAELREEATSANKSIEIVSALNASTSALIQAYNRAQQTMVESVKNVIEKLDKMFELDTVSVPGKTLIKAKYDGLYSMGSISAGGIGESGGGGGGEYDTIFNWNNYNPSEQQLVGANLIVGLKDRITALETSSSTVFFGEESNHSVALTVNGITKSLTLTGHHHSVVDIDGLLDSGTGKLLTSLIPDSILGQVVYGGNVNASGVCTLTTEFKRRYSIESLTLSTANAKDYEGVFFICTANGTVAGVSVENGDWLISNGTVWQRVDNTDAVTSVCGHTGAVSAEQIKTAISLSDYLPLTGGTLTGPLTATKFVKKDGTASQFLKADGSLDSTSYVKSSQNITFDSMVTSASNVIRIKKSIGVDGTDTNISNKQHNMQFEIQNGDSNHAIAIGVFDTETLQASTSPYGRSVARAVIQAKANGIGYDPLYLNPLNAPVFVGNFDPLTSKDYKFAVSGKGRFTNTVTAASFIKQGGTSAQFLKADGSVDSNTYATTAQLTNGSVTKVGTNNVGAVDTPIYLKAGVPTAITSIKDEMIELGGANRAGSVGAIDAALLMELGANRFAFKNPNDIVIESTIDGSTWVEEGYSDAAKVSIVSGLDSSIYSVSSRSGRGTSQDSLLAWLQQQPVLSRSTSSTTETVKYDISKFRTRITLTFNNNPYAAIQKFLIWFTTSGSSGCKCSISYWTLKNYNSGNEVWTPLVTEATMSGWSGWNVINTSVQTAGWQDAQAKKIRFEFWGDSMSTSRNLSTDTYSTLYTGCCLQKIYAIGPSQWSTQSNMARTNHLYSYDWAQNAIFPAEVRTTGNIKEGSKYLYEKYLAIEGLAKGLKLSAGRLASADALPSAGAGAVEHFLATSAMTTHKPCADGHILQFIWDNNPTTAKVQLFLPAEQSSSAYSMQWRAGKTYTNIASGEWRTLLDTFNWSQHISLETIVGNDLAANIKLVATLFERDANGDVRVRNNAGLYSNSFISAGGVSDEDRSTTVQVLEPAAGTTPETFTFPDYSSATDRFALSAALGYQIDRRVTGLQERFVVGTEEEIAAMTKVPGRFYCIYEDE